MTAALDLPDVPRWLEAHGIAADPDGWQRALGGGVAFGSDRARLVVVAGEAEPAAVTALARELPGHAMLFARERADLARATGRAAVRAILHTLPTDELPVELEGAELLPAELSLAHLPAPLLAELASVRELRPIWTVLLDGLPVSFAYAPWRSKRWFDVSVDTVPGARQLGLGRIVAAAMIHGERALGREPVWGADEDNRGSLALAHGLGFIPVDELWVAA